ncbi:MAG: branched-chain amino acid ABC transporter permease [Candidatus Carbobacillus altaicus]|nr:branched-chain amino acid ABC transporter permease [Candidatus Carbobacillus altaicus]
MEWLNPYQVQIATFILINILLALSVYMTLATGQLSLGQAGFMSIGAYTAALFVKNLGWPLLPALVMAMLSPALVALVIGWPTLRLRGLYLAIATLGFGEVVRVVILNLPFTGGALGLKGLPSLGTMLMEPLKAMGMTKPPFGLSVPLFKALLTFVFIFILILIVLWLLARLMKARVGRAFYAIRSDEVAAQAMGIHLQSYKMLSFVMGSMLAGLGGGLFAFVTTAIAPEDFSYHRVVEMLSFAVIGGSELIWGPVLGAILLTALPEVLRILSDYKMLFYGLTLLLVMALRPRGLFTLDTVRFWRRRKKTVPNDGA